ncbi:MAG TPA: hypothetical protein VII38_16730 [Polyangia bacterium]|jgi:hypothetical protein
MQTRLLYIAACLIAPLLWGLASYAAARFVERRLPKPPPRDRQLPDLEYYL